MRIPPIRVLAPALAAVVGASGAAAAGGLGAPGELGEGPEHGARSAIVRAGDAPLLARPDASAPRRGSGARGAALPVFGARTGPGCGRPFFLVGPHAWVCGDHVEPSLLPPLAAAAAEPASSGLRYYFVGRDGSSGYETLAGAELDPPVVSFEPGFAVAVVEVRRAGGEPYGRTEAGPWVPMRDLGPASPSAFAGRELAPGERPDALAWVVVESARLFERAGPGLLRPSSPGLVRFEALRVLGEERVSGETYLEVLSLSGDSGGESGKLVRARDVRRPSSAPPPPEVDLEVGERWVDVELASQTLVAYEGERPVFATLVSTGKGRAGSANETPVGTHRVWVKLLSAHMDNLEDEEASRFWRMESVPHVQYFSKGVGLHGAYWHRSFGNRRSHGCVNLAPRDAARLFGWTTPRLPAGWTAVLPSRHDRATVVRVR